MFPWGEKVAFKNGVTNVNVVIPPPPPNVPFSVLFMVPCILQEYVISLYYLSFCVPLGFSPCVLIAFHCSFLPLLLVTFLHWAASFLNKVCYSERAWPQICGAQEFQGLVILIPLIPPERGNCIEDLRKWVRYRGRSLCGYWWYTSHLQSCTGEDSNWG